MKIASILSGISVRQKNGSKLTYRLIHTGQHYDERLSGDFFAQLGIPSAHVNLEVGSGTQAQQTSGIMLKYEKLLADAPAQICLVVGDVTSTMACAIVAQKQCVPVAHVEAGIRSGDWTMPEEINRIVTDAITNYFFTTSEFANANLRRAGVAEESIYFVGNTMVDTLLANLDRLRPPAFFQSLELVSGEYFVLTMHRPSNVDSAENLVAALHRIAHASRTLPVVFPAHPRTSGVLAKLADLPGNLKIVEPQPYLEFNYLVKNCKAVITDSGGITEEATIMGVPCITLRKTTERPETVTVGTNELVGDDPAKLLDALDRVFEGRWKPGGIPEKWDGRAGQRIAAALDGLTS